MWFFSENLFEYLRQRAFGQKVADMLLMISVFTWVAGVYIVATNYNAIKQAFFTQAIDMKGLIQLDKNINDILSHVMNTVGADRSALARFHNTVTDLQGRHFVYQSRSNEVVQPGVSLVAQLRQGILVSMINVWAQSFIKNECFYMTDVQPTDLFYEFLRQIGTKSDMKCPVFNIENVLVGFLNIEFTTRTVSLPEMKKMEKEVRDAASKIGVILSIKQPN